MNKTIGMVMMAIALGSVTSPVWADGLDALALPPQWAWLPGTLFGCFAGLWGTVLGILAPRGRAQSFVMGFGAVLIVAMAVMLLLGLILLLTGHSFWSWYPWLLPGFIGLFVLPPIMRVARVRYAEAEMRKLEAMDMS